jgi:hypothetical protein
MENVSKIEAVTERDIDLLLLEELNVSDEFALWLYSEVTGKNDARSCKGAWHSISDPSLGESDLVVIYDNGVAVLLENKIDAPAQPEQGQRYKARGEIGMQDGLWISYITCMVAPSLYLQKEGDAQIYDHILSYEDIASWFEFLKGVNRRRKYKAYLIREAVEQNRRGYTLNPDHRVTEFWRKYWEFSNTQHPDLEMKQPGIKPANSDWPYFQPSLLDRRFTIVHKLERGYVDLQISGAADKLELLRGLVSEIEVEVAQAGKSAAIRIKVGSINRFATFDSQKDIVSDGMVAASKLLAIGQELANEI